MGRVSDTRLADPVLTASIYCEGHLDGVLRDVLAPFLAELRQHAPDARLWTVRYGRRGQHLKVRLHGHGLELPRLHERLCALAESFFGGLPPPPAERSPRLAVPAIDREDEPDDLQPDRTVLATSYRRSFVSLGGEPFLSRDAYAERMTECLARACELVLAALADAPAGAMPSGARQKILLKALLSGLPAAGFATPERAVAYLGYHRDWLLRFFLADEGEERAARERLDQQLERSAATLVGLRRIGLGEAPRPGDDETSWPAAVARLASDLAPFRDDPEQRTDPFAPDAAHPAYFKVFHGTANQAGLRPLEEAYVHHLLMAAFVGEPSLAAAGGGLA